MRRHPFTSVLLSWRLTLASVVHLSPAQGGHFGLPGNLIVDGTPTVESTTKVSGETNYICGYESTNDIPDDQNISTQFTSLSFSTPLSSNAHLPPMNLALNFTIVAQTSSICMCQTHLHSDHGRVIGDMSTPTFVTLVAVRRYVRGGHDGGDAGSMRAWLKESIKE